jgi:LacI family transcriptional regulator
VGSTTGRRVTLHDVAKEAGVSPTTVSYILNGRSSQMRISLETQERVRQAADRLGYRPNRSAQSLRTASTQTIGLISDFVASGHYASRMLTGASTAARGNDHLLVIGETEGDTDQQVALIDEMIDRGVDGFVYATLATAEVVVPELLSRRRTVLLNCLDRSHSLPAVLPNEFEGGRTAAGVMLEAGIVAGLYLVGEEPTADSLAGRERLEGVRARLDEVHSEIAGVIDCAWDVGPAFEATSAWLGTGARPQGLICLNDRVAMGVYQALAEAGLDVPGDVAVVSFDGSELAGWLRPKLASIEIPYADLGALAVHTLMQDDWADAGISRLSMPFVPGGSLR